MRVFQDSEGREIRLTDERNAHIVTRHPEVFEIEGAIELTLSAPDFVRQSRYDIETAIYYRFFQGLETSGAWVRVVVALKDDDAFILTAMTTRRIQLG